MLKYLNNRFLNAHMRSESEQYHFLTTLYGLLINENRKSKNYKTHQKIAKSIELLKCSTLIVDDILDKTPKRNNIDSFYKRYGPEKSILIAEILKSTSSISFIESIRSLGLSGEKENKCIMVFEDTYRLICLGQLQEFYYLNSLNGSWKQKEKMYWEIIYNTTACFIQLPLHIAAIIKGYDENDYKCISDYGKNIGLAYQVRDDVTDIVFDSKYVGRYKGGDLREKKIRLPLILFVKRNPVKNLSIIKKLFNKKEISYNDVNYFIDLLRDYNIIEDINIELNSLIKRAKKSILSLNDSAVSKNLLKISNLLNI
jgi:geranylgeranyl pyrophosphate synthase